MVKEGYDLEKVKGDPVFFYNAKDGSVVPLTQEILAQIRSGSIKL